MNVEHFDKVETSPLFNRLLYFVWSLPGPSGQSNAIGTDTIPAARSTVFQLKRR
jgi:hypothetical protein